MSEAKATGKLKVCSCGKCRQIWNVDDDTLMAVALCAGDENYTGGEGYTHERALSNADEIALRWNAHDSLLARNKRLTEALQKFVAAEKEYRDNVISDNPEAYDDPLCEAYDKACKVLGEDKEQTHEPTNSN